MSEAVRAQRGGADEGCSCCLLDLVGRANEIMHDVSALALAAVADAIQNFTPGRIVEANDQYACR